MTFSFPFGLRLNKILLLSANVLSGIVFIILQNKGVFPMDQVHFAFFSFVVLLFALYRPGWVFLLLIGMLPFETISVTELLGSVAIRPYQWLLVLLGGALVLRFVTGKLPFKLFRPKWYDALLVLIALGAYLGSVSAPDKALALKQAVIVTTFVALYCLGRVFLRTLTDVKQTIPFFVSSSLVVFGYALWQNISFLMGNESYQVMAGRPNATFSEADWLGLFALFILSFLFALFIFLIKKNTDLASSLSYLKESLSSPSFWLLFVLETLTFVVLLIALSRSAWLGAVAAFIVAAVMLLFYYGRAFVRSMFGPTAFFEISTGISFGVALLLIVVLHFSPFSLFQRAQSTASGLQKITIACERSTSYPPAVIKDVQELTSYHCQHINLEDIDKNLAQGKIVREVLRNDPNVSIRKETYGEVWDLIKKYPLTGIGWGSVSVYLGTDERGAGLNASNMFLEMWLGSGLIGFLAFLVLWCLSIIAAAKGYFTPNEEGERIFSLFILIALSGITVFNLFNSGILLGLFFIFLSLCVLNIERVGISFKKDA